MPRRLQSGERLVLATHNKGKLKEVRALLAPYEITVLSAGDIALDEPEETGATFAENARLKAHAVAKAAQLPALADDSGLCIDALGGAPGVFSARWAGEAKDFSQAMRRVEEELRRKSIATSPAHFTCSLMLAWPDGEEALFQGHVQGRLIFPPRGSQGFGYDPIFIPENESRTFAEMTMDEKKKFSHRARAFAAFAQACLPAMSAA